MDMPVHGMGRGRIWVCDWLLAFLSQLSSGAARIFFDSRCRVGSPSSPSTGMSTLASTTITVLPQGRDLLGERNRSPGPTACSFQDLFHRRRGRFFDQPLAQVSIWDDHSREIPCP
jgi:hypothetical protein